MATKTPGRQGLLILVALALLTSGCSGPAGRTPGRVEGGPPGSSTEPDRPAAPGGPLDPIAAGRVVRDTFSSPLFTARVKIRGRATTRPTGPTVAPAAWRASSAAQAPKVREYVGQAYVSRGDHLVRMRVDDAPSTVIAELRRAGRVWQRSDDQAWRQVALGAGDPGTRLFDLLAGVSDLEPAGESVDGSMPLLRFFVREVTLDLPVLWLRETAAGACRGSIEILALRDGTPVRLRVRVTSAGVDGPGSVPPGVAVPPREYAFDYELSAVGEPILLPDVQPLGPARALDNAGMGVRTPPGWEVVSDKSWARGGGAAELRGPGPTNGELVVVRMMRGREPDGSPEDPAELLDAFAAWAIRDLVAGVGMTIVSTEATSVAGHPAYVVALLRTPPDLPAYLHQEAIFVLEPWLYAVSYQSRPEAELVARFEFEQLLATVTLEE